jgi:hypothetical protein
MIDVLFNYTISKHCISYLQNSQFDKTGIGSKELLKKIFIIDENIVALDKKIVTEVYFDHSNG